MEKTRPYLDGGKEVVGYMLNTGFSTENIAKIQGIQQYLEGKFPGSFIFYPGETLHITLMDWTAPLVDYGRDKDELFEELYPEYDKVLTDILKVIKLITVHFKEIRVSPDAIFIVGEDDGSYQKIRDEFIGQIELEEGTKRPPQIIHSTIARFREEVEVGEIQLALNSLNLDLVQSINDFRLVKETEVPMQKFQEIGRFSIGL